MNTFERLAPFIKDYIYREKWENLREIQVAACDVLFNTDSNLLLSSGTASGKTEAAFLPVLTMLYENSSDTVGVLYISPLKALINDQFIRLNGLLEESGIKVTKWHGDASVSDKNKLLKEPQGIIQTTPESLEAMIMKRKTEVLRLFSDLRYIIIDEVHSFMNEDRGVQLLCVLERISKITNTNPIRIGLSATLQDYEKAENWMNSGTNRNCITPQVNGSKRQLRLSMEHFYVKYEPKTDHEKVLMNKYYEYLYAATFGKKCIVFSNAKAEVEENIANLKSMARKNHTPDNYMVHHGNVSASIREWTESKMKSSDDKIVTGATLTLELGIDLGQLERIVQTGCPISVSSFVQRLGRSGRRGQPSEIWFAFREDQRNTNLEFFKAINWSFLKCIAICELYIKEKWVEPMEPKTLPMSVLYHQTMSYMASAVEVTPAILAQNILTLSPFKNTTQADYKELLSFMLEKKQLERSENGGLLIGQNGEYQIGNYEFYSVFQTPQEYSVKFNAEEIGTVQEAFPKGERFALAGRSWEVLEIDKKAEIIYVNEIFGISTNQWYGFNGIPVHNKVMKKMREILISDTPFSYLSDAAANRLRECRAMARGAGILDKSIVKIVDGVYGIFSFIGTRELVTLSYILNANGLSNELLILKNVPVCVMVRHKEISPIKEILNRIKNNEVGLETVILPDNVMNGGKYDEYIPATLRKKQFKKDFLNIEGLREGIK
jgi:ATP-dependent helicase Lhr and Lhr-like helicase